MGVGDGSRQGRTGTLDHDTAEAFLQRVPCFFSTASVQIAAQ